MSTLALAVVVAVASAGCYAVGAVLQERIAAQVPLRRAGALLSRRGWWMAVALGGVGTLLHVVALRYGPLNLIQPLGALTLVLALPVGAAMVRRPVTGAQWRGAGLTTAGLAILLLLTVPVAQVRTLGTGPALAVTAVTGGMLLALVLAAVVLRRIAVPRSLLFAAAAGLAFGVGSALTQTVAVRFTTAGLAGLVTPSTVAVIGFAVGGFLLAQASYRGSGLGAPLAILTLVNPAAATLIGLTLLGERYAGGLPGAALALVAMAIATWGVALLVQPLQSGSAGAGTDRLSLDRPVAQRGPELVALDVHVGHDPVEPAR